LFSSRMRCLTPILNDCSTTAGGKASDIQAVFSFQRPCMYTPRCSGLLTSLLSRRRQKSKPLKKWDGRAYRFRRTAS
jgi:hypothetical protein